MVQRRPSLKPLQLITRHGMSRRDLKNFPVAFGDSHVYRSPFVALEQTCEPNGLNSISRANARIIRLFGKPQRQHALFLQMDAKYLVFPYDEKPEHTFKFVSWMRAKDRAMINAHPGQPLSGRMSIMK